ncbi:hypothetical protein LY78DRAFT_650013 [Colletotrichum sublineola]|nr:hypothetical protein LY78DRAFT_650013 [Colletotrichum sublineola]
MSWATRRNPLVIGKNDTLSSDKRVFASDGNRTIQDLGRTRGGFKTACADVFTRMIDTVPSAVQLTEPIEAVDIKPYVGLVLSGNGSITFSGLVRVRTTGGTWRDTNDLAVHLSFTDRNGEGSVTVPATLDEGGGDVCLVPVRDRRPRRERNQGILRPADDPMNMELVRLVRRQGVVHRQLEMERIRLAVRGKEKSGHVVFREHTQLPMNGWSTSFDLVLGGGVGKEVRVDFLKTQTCPRAYDVGLER